MITNQKQNTFTEVLNKKTTLHAVARGQHKDSNIVRPHTIHFSHIDTI
jgi:hypothetical protein